MHATVNVTFSLYVVFIMDEVRAVVTFSRDTKGDGNKEG